MDYPGKCREPVGSKYDHLIPYLFYVMADEQLWRDMKHLPAGDTRKGQNLASLVNLYAKAIEEKDESILTDDIMTALHQPFVTIEGYGGAFNTVKISCLAFLELVLNQLELDGYEFVKKDKSDTQLPQVIQANIDPNQLLMAVMIVKKLLA